MQHLQSFFLGGFECSSHRRADKRRLDLIAATGHDRCSTRDYELLVENGIHAARDGVRWHLVEREPGKYDWSSLTPMLDAANEAGVQVIWDLCHYGWPDHLDVWSEECPEAFAKFAVHAAQLVAERSRIRPVFCPVNEISYWAWAGGDAARINPFARGRGADLKRQLVRMAVAATRAIRQALPKARFICSEPLIHVVAASEESQAEARKYHDSQYEAVDMLLGRRWPELGGSPECLDLIGLNFYPDNQWVLGGSTIPFGHPGYAPLSVLLQEVADRYQTPILLTETGAEGSARASWLHYVCGEVRRAMTDGVSVAGVCLYPVTDYPGWEDERHCPAGLFSLPGADGRRSTYEPLASELGRQQESFLSKGIRRAAGATAAR